MAALTPGPLGGLHVFPRRVHQGLDVVLVAGLALSPVLAGGHLNVLGVVLAEASAVIVAWLFLVTRYMGTARNTDTARDLDRGRDIDTASRPRSPSATESPVERTVQRVKDSNQRSVSTSRALGAYAVHRARARQPRPPEEVAARQAERHRKIQAGARQLGLAVGRARRRKV